MRVCSHVCVHVQVCVVCVCVIRACVCVHVGDAFARFGNRPVQLTAALCFTSNSIVSLSAKDRRRRSGMPKVNSLNYNG